MDSGCQLLSKCLNILAKCCGITKPQHLQKKYAVGLEQVDPYIPTVLLNFMGGETGYSNGIMQLVDE
jgi:hypothetical protein